LTLVYYGFVNGPWPWPVGDNNPVYWYLIVCQLVIVIGYISNSNYLNRTIISAEFRHKKNYFYYLFSLAFILNVLTLYGRTGSWNLNIFSGYDQLGYLYTKTFEGRIVIVEYVRMIFAISLFSFIPIGLYEYRRLKAREKVLFAVSLYFFITSYIKMGTNKGIFDIIIMLPWIFIISYIRRGKRSTRKKSYKRVLLFSAILLFGFYFFTQSQLQRKGEVGAKAIHNMGNTLLEANQEKPDFISQEFYLGYLALNRYLTSGYYAFSRSFDIEYSNTFPFGSSMFLTRHADNIFNTDYFQDKSFPGELEKTTGWSYFELWHSLYSWLVSDYGHGGILLILFILSRWLAKYWMLSLIDINPINMVKFLLLMIVFLYIPANNQIFQNAESSITFIVLFFNPNTFIRNMK
jgi:hypothetical protein